MATSAPSRAKASAVACPIPESAPVTMATLFSRRMSGLLFRFEWMAFQGRTQVHDGSDEGCMYEGLRKIPEHPVACGVCFLGEKAKVVRVIQRPVDDAPGLRDVAPDD